MFAINPICQSTTVDLVLVSDFQDRDSAVVRMKFGNSPCKTCFVFSSRDSHSQRCVLIVFSIENVSTAMSAEIGGLRKHCQTRMYPPTRQGR
jgi:hypothetical protein